MTGATEILTSVWQDGKEARQSPSSSQAASLGIERPLEGRKRKPSPGVHGYPSTCMSHVHVILLAVKRGTYY